MSAVGALADKLETDGRKNAAAKLRRMESDFWPVFTALKSDAPDWSDETLAAVTAAAVSGLLED